MALGLQTTSASGDFLPYATYDARAGRMFKVDRSQASTGEWIKTPTDITSPPPTFALDAGTLEVGWITFAPAPDFQMVPLGQPLPTQPGKDYKQGFRVKIAGKVVDGLRTFSHNAKCVLTAMDALHTAYEAAPEAAQGKIPVVRLTGTIPVVTRGPVGTPPSTNYSPIFEIVTWTDRTEELGSRTVPAPGVKTNGAHHAPPPAPPPATTAEPPQTVRAPDPEGMPTDW